MDHFVEKHDFPHRFTKMIRLKLIILLKNTIFHTVLQIVIVKARIIQVITHFPSHIMLKTHNLPHPSTTPMEYSGTIQITAIFPNSTCLTQTHT